jgi:transcriptional regulator with XRE-family HTH domain
LLKVLIIMGRNKITLLPKMRRILEDLGENIKMARLRRKLSAEQVAERANVTRYVIGQIEKGAPAVSIGVYVQVLFVLGMEADLARIASEDPLGRKLQDIDLTVSERAPKKNKSNGKDK